MKLSTYAKLLALSKEKIEQLLVPIRANQTLNQGKLAVSKLDEEIATLECRVQEIATKHPLDFDSLLSAQDRLAITERKRRQFLKALRELFPAAKFNDDVGAAESHE